MSIDGKGTISNDNIIIIIIISIIIIKDAKIFEIHLNPVMLVFMG